MCPSKMKRFNQKRELRAYDYFEKHADNIRDAAIEGNLVARAIVSMVLSDDPDIKDPSLQARIVLVDLIEKFKNGETL